MRKFLSLIMFASALASAHVGAARIQRSPNDAANKNRAFNKSGVAARESIKLGARGRRIVLRAEGRTRVLDLGEKISSARLETVKLLFVTRRDDFVYLVADARGWSKLRQDMHECGAGEEYDLLWLKLTPDWRLADAQAARYESCWGSTTSEDGYEIKQNVLRLTYSDFSRKRESQLTYDADQPERGFQIKESELKDQ